MATDIGQAIKENRIKKGMTQADLADKVGLATITIRQYENGTREPKLEVLRKIAISLGVSIYSLVDFDGATSLLEQDMTESRIEYGSEWEQFVRVQAAFFKTKSQRRRESRGSGRGSCKNSRISRVDNYRKQRKRTTMYRRVDVLPDDVL